MHMSQATVVICIAGAVWRKPPPRASGDLVAAARSTRVQAPAARSTRVPAARYT